MSGVSWANDDGFQKFKIKVVCRFLNKASVDSSFKCILASFEKISWKNQCTYYYGQPWNTKSTVKEGYFGTVPTRADCLSVCKYKVQVQRNESSPLNYKTKYLGVVLNQGSH